MEFYVIVIIFIVCMIALAILIYYCQEKKGSKYSIQNNPEAITNIAFSIGAPGFIPPRPPNTPCDFYYVKSSKPVSAECSRNANANVCLPSPSSYNEELTDSGSSSSSQIYFDNKETTYSVSKNEANDRRRQSQPTIIVHKNPHYQHTLTPPTLIIENELRYRSASHYGSGELSFPLVTKSRSVTPEPILHNNLHLPKHDRKRSGSVPTTFSDVGAHSASFKYADTLSLHYVSIPLRKTSMYDRARSRSVSPVPCIQLTTVEELTE